MPNFQVLNKWYIVCFADHHFLFSDFMLEWGDDYLTIGGTMMTGTTFGNSESLLCKYENGILDGFFASLAKFLFLVLNILRILVIY